MNKKAKDNLDHAVCSELQSDSNVGHKWINLLDYITERIHSCQEKDLRSTSHLEIQVHYRLGCSFKTTS
jgi:hypothetical protein